MCFSLSRSFGDGVEVYAECRVPNTNVFRLLFYPVIPGHAMLFERSVLSHIPKTDYVVYDLLLALTANLFGGIVVCPEVLNLHRRHNNAFSYSKPKNYNRSIFNVFNYIFSGIIGYFFKRDKIRRHFLAMDCLLSAFDPNIQDELVKDALLFSQYMFKGSFSSILEASRICFKTVSYTHLTLPTILRV